MSVGGDVHHHHYIIIIIIVYFIVKVVFYFIKVDTARVMLRSSEPYKDYINASFVDVSTYVLGALTLYRPRSNS